MEARAFVPGQWPLQNRHERLRPAVQLDAARIARYAATRCSSPGIPNSCRGVQPGPRARCVDAPRRGHRGRSRDVAAGDIACPDPCRAQRRTARLIRVLDPRAVLTLGDNQYEDGRFADFMDSYRPTWGRFKRRTHPTPGNHDYHVAGARGYFSYFGRRAHRRSGGMYSVSIGNWHVVSINTGNGLSIGSSDGSAGTSRTTATGASSPSGITAGLPVRARVGPADGAALAGPLPARRRRRVERS